MLKLFIFTDERGKDRGFLFCLSLVNEITNFRKTSGSVVYCDCIKLQIKAKHNDLMDDLICIFNHITSMIIDNQNN